MIIAQLVTDGLVRLSSSDTYARRATALRDHDERTGWQTSLSGHAAKLTQQKVEISALWTEQKSWVMTNKSFKPTLRGSNEFRNFPDRRTG